MKTLAILFGGKSAEHEVSVRSARNVLAALDQTKYTVVLIGIGQSGRWQLVDTDYLSSHDQVGDDQPAIAFLPGGQGQLIGATSLLPKIDVVLPILHGPFGEDGTTQGILRAALVPFVGAGVLGSAIGMDKVIMKQVLHDSGLPVGDFLMIRAATPIDYDTVVAKLGTPFFVKPANLGSSVGVNKVHNATKYSQCLKEAFRFDRKVIVEQTIVGRELECAVLGNDEATASSVGEVIPREEFYSYSAKYLNKDGAALVIPAQLDDAVVSKIQQLAVATFHALDCAGLARVDFFLQEDGTPLINEINTLPGFTSISMYPKLWAEVGISYSELIDRLINFAVERFRQETKLQTTV
jgi:D-alanine-D-alanine ligase